MLVQLSRFLRYSLDNGGNVDVPLKQEIEALQLYFKIEQARFADRLKVFIDVDAQVDEFRVPSLLLQPLVENAIKHAIAHAEKGGVIRVTATLHGDFIDVRVADSGLDRASRKRLMKVPAWDCRTSEIGYRCAMAMLRNLAWVPQILVGLRSHSSYRLRVQADE